MIKCEHCGTEYEEPKSVFCDKCGHKMKRFGGVRKEQEQELIRCHTCGHRNKPDTTTCFNCGELLHTPSL